MAVLLILMVNETSLVYPGSSYPRGDWNPAHFEFEEVTFPSALILQRTFNSLADAAQSHYPWLPIKYIMRNQYPSAEKIKRCSMPLYQSHGSADQMIPISLGRKLHGNSPAQHKVFNEIQGMGHLDPLPSRYWAERKQFIDSIDQASSRSDTRS